MILGGALTQRLGDPEGILEPPTMIKIVGGLRISEKARVNYEQNVVPIVDNVVDPAFFAPSTTPGSYVKFIATTTKHTAVMYDNGDWGTPTGDVLAYAFYFGIDSGKTITYNITSAVQGELADDATFTIDTVTGAQRGLNVIPDLEERPNWTYLTYECDGAIITFYGMNEIAVCSGVAAVGAVTCSPLNDSGLTLEITMSSTAAATGNAYLRWPEKYGIYWTGGVTPDAYVNDDGASSQFSYTTAILDAGTYTPEVSQFDDNENESSKATGAAIEIFELPDAPNLLAYNDSTEVVSWGYPGGPDPDEWNVYDSGSNAENFMDVGYSVATITGLPLQYSLPAGIPAFPYTRRIIVRASIVGHQEKNVNILSIEYDAAGNYVPARPNTPYLSGAPDAESTTININVSYSPVEQAVSPDSIKLFAWILGDAPDWTTVRGTVSTGTIQKNASPRILAITADLSGLVGAGANIQFGVRAFSGTYDDNNSTIYGPVALTTVAPPAPTFTAEAGV